MLQGRQNLINLFVIIAVNKAIIYYFCSMWDSVWFSQILNVFF